MYVNTIEEYRQILKSKIKFLLGVMVYSLLIAILSIVIIFIYEFIVSDDNFASYFSVILILIVSIEATVLLMVLDNVYRLLQTYSNFIGNILGLIAFIIVLVIILSVISLVLSDDTDKVYNTIVNPLFNKLVPVGTKIVSDKKIFLSVIILTAVIVITLLAIL
jgi:hypothetical protein